MQAVMAVNSTSSDSSGYRSGDLRNLLNGGRHGPVVLQLIDLSGFAKRAFSSVLQLINYPEH
jgi:hypothetical protein